MKPKLERIAYALILGPVLPLLGLLLGWFSSYYLVPEKWIPAGTLAGLFIGILADGFLRRELIDRAARFSLGLWAAIFLFYAVGVFGFFMGVPIFNALLAIPAGFVVAARMVNRKADPGEERRFSWRTAWFTTAVLLLTCAASAFFALASASTPSDLKGLLGLPFEVTQGMVIGLIVVGGLLLLAFNWVLAFFSTHFSYKLLQRGA